jgi:predicted nucleic acid-binding Zn ribbon protein
MATKRPQNSRPTKIGDLLKDFMDKSLPKNLGEEAKVFGAWPGAVGQDVSRQAKPKAFRNGILFVETKHPLWTTELTAKRHVILRKINGALGKEMVRDIHFRLARL